ncbi:MAG: hypothetical protein HAW62_04490 [Endozoicomonadaceae bacterium]|nr:hypothetical protein [Endozoicomonadaceae bacterium]
MVEWALIKPLFKAVIMVELNIASMPFEPIVFINFTKRLESTGNDHCIYRIQKNIKNKDSISNLLLFFHHINHEYAVILIKKPSI